MLNATWLTGIMSYGYLAKQHEVVIYITDNLNTWLVLYKLGIIYQVCFAEILHWKANGTFLLKVGKKIFYVLTFI